MTAPTIKLDTAEECARWLIRYAVTPRQIRKWAARGHIQRHGDLYEAREIADYLDNRDTRMDEVRRGLTLRDRCGTLPARDASPKPG